MAVAAAVGVLGCNDSESSNAFDKDSGDASTGSPTTDSASGNGPGTSAATAATESGQGSTTSDATSTGQGSTGDMEIKLDVGAPDGDFDGCGCELTYIWISNAENGTVSKINTRTLEEEGRYLTRPDGAGNPSRTSVNLAGDVAIANRHGGLVKFYAQEEDCQESNGMPGIQTSSGPGNVLAWDMEECRAWYTEFPTTNQRPVAWTPGAVTPGTCDSTDEMVWTVTSAVPGLGPGTGGQGGVIAYLVDGEDGSIAQEIPIDEFSGFNLGAYGGAVDGGGNLFFSPMGALNFGGGLLVRVDRETFEVTTHEIPQNVASYGITVDHNGRVWLSSTLGSGAARFDPDTQTWETVGGFISAGGLAEGPDNLMWVATEAGANSVDIETMALGAVFATNQGGTVKGISVDVDGYVWAVNEIAFKIDPMTGAAVDFYNGLTSPYTYSDMTGYALGQVTCPPAG